MPLLLDLDISRPIPGGGDGAPRRVMFQGVIGGSGGPCLAEESGCGTAGGGERSS